jgi:hypothetical protein
MQEVILFDLFIIIMQYTIRNTDQRFITVEEKGNKYILCDECYYCGNASIDQIIFDGNLYFKDLITYLNSLGCSETELKELYDSTD